MSAAKTNAKRNEPNDENNDHNLNHKMSLTKIIISSAKWRIPKAAQRAGIKQPRVERIPYNGTSATLGNDHEIEIFNPRLVEAYRQDISQKR